MIVAGLVLIVTNLAPNETGRGIAIGMGVGFIISALTMWWRGRNERQVPNHG